MNEIFEYHTLIYSSMTDHTGMLGIPNLFALFMDAATAHAEQLGFGADAMKARGLFWLTVKTKIRINSRPRLMEEVQVQTWPGKPERYRCPRYYRLLRKEEVLAEGKTEWAVWNINSGSLAPAKEAYPDNLPLVAQTVCDGPFARIVTDFSQAPLLETYCVRSTDIDLGGHMNNAAYIRTVFGAISTKELDAENITEAEALFKMPCYEGEALRLLRQQKDAATEYAVLRPDGQAAFLMRLTY